MTPVTPVTGRDDRALRLRRVRDRLHEERLEGLLVSHLPDVRWLSGFSGSAALLLVEPGSATLVTDFRYAIQAEEETGPDVAVRIAEADVFEALAACLEEGGASRRMGFEDHDLTVRDRRALGEACAGTMWEPAGQLLTGLRTRKDASEVAAIRRAIEVAEHALEDVLGRIEPGDTESRLAAELAYRLRLRGAESTPFDPIVASGPRTALPHARAGDREVVEGDLLLIDFGAVVDGYCSDMTRMFTIGPAAGWQGEIHALVREALERAISVTAAGTPAREVDRAARTVIESAGFGGRFGHGTGHGVGLEVHEAPRVNARSTDTLEAGNVVTIEPGVYLPGRGGVRLEEVVLVEEGGCRVLTSRSLDLQTLPAG